MSSDGGSQRLIDYVAQSPRLCAAHDKAGWLGLFAADAQINDPVGSRPHQGRAALDNFYDTFIAPNALSFAVEHDIVRGMSVMRDLTLTSTMSTGLAIPVPMHLRYDLVDENGALKIHRLYAHWELPVLLAQQLGSVKGWLTALQLTPQLLRYQGVGGLFGFMRGLFGRGRAGKRTVEVFLRAVGAGEVNAASIHLEEQTARSARELVAGLRGLSWRKVLAAGDYVSVTLELGARRAVAVFRFDEGSERISSLEIFG